MNSAPEISRFSAVITGPAPWSLLAADALCRLIVEGGELGELPMRAIPRADGGAREVKTVPLEWFGRLADAAERGALDRYPVEQIVARILSSPADAAP